MADTPKNRYTRPQDTVECSPLLDFDPARDLPPMGARLILYNVARDVDFHPIIAYQCVESRDWKIGRIP
jgi:hypothetical protein